MITKAKKFAVLAGIVLGAAGLASAQSSNSVITFQLDMSVQVTNGTFIPGTDTVAARGTFNGYGQFFLTNNPAGVNTNLYTGTVTDTADANGGVLSYKFWTSDASGGWESTTVSGHNRAARLPATSGASLVLPPAYYNDASAPATNAVTFRVNLAQQINLGTFTPGTSLVYARGDFNGFGTTLGLTNDPSITVTNQFGLVTSNVYVGTASVGSSPNATETFKYFIDTGANWESPAGTNQADGGNRFYVNTGAQSLPIVFFSDNPYAPIVTNNVTFSVDMSLQVLSGAFDPANYIVGVAGNFTGWASAAVQLTNDPAASNTNIYSKSVPVTDGVGATEQYKFIHTVSGGLDWESPGPSTPQIGGNRFIVLGNTNATVLPTVFYSDTGTSDVLLSNTLVTFTVDMTNAVGTDAVAWNLGQNVYLSGDFIGWNNNTWNTSLPQMSNNPVGSSFYTYQTNFHAGHGLPITYKYSINGVDDEAGIGQNHFRYIRSEGVYNFPVDTFGNQLVEQSFGNLAIGSPSGGSIPISWLGRPGVHLQSRTNLTSGSWVDVTGTDATSSANIPFTGTSQYFRLVHPLQ